MADKIRVSARDARIQYKTADVNGKKYGYLLGLAESGRWRKTIFLIHGFPDLSMGWRYQIPMLIDLGLRVIAPDCVGYGRTDAPNDLALYSFKSCADDIKELAHQLGCSKIILGGHDWGAALAYRIALWHPDLISHLLTVCVPFTVPTANYTSLEDLVKRSAPNLGYQLHFKSGELEKVIRSKNDIRQFLLATYGGRTPEGEVAFDAERGILLDRMFRVRPSRLLSEDEIEYYYNEFSRNGIRGPLNWYRTREINFKDELAILGRRITCPVLFIQALRDQALPPSLGKSMRKNIAQLSVKQVNTAHWALWEKPEEVNELISSWIRNVALSDGMPANSKL